MPVERKHGEIVVECNSCGDKYETVMTDFASAMRLYEVAGGKVKYGRSGWGHFCKNCRSKPSAIGW